MSSQPNLFPDYPVASLGRGEQARTVSTEGIEKISRLVAGFLDSGSSANPLAGLNVPVQGEFGTGKTHLLAFAREMLEAEATERKTPTTVLTADGLESSPAGWYREVIGPGLVASGAVHDQLLTLYAEAAKGVASRAPLTQGAVSTIEGNPGSARTLVQSEMLSPTSVDEAFIDLLERAFTEASVEIAIEVRRALISAVSKPDLSLRWLRGEDLSEREQLETGLPEAIATDDLASDAIIAVAALTRHLRRPFALLVDELEHFLRFDQITQSRRNTTWLKRLLERLVRCSALVLVAGRSSAWQGQPDFLDRFSPGADIELSPLTGLEVMMIVTTIQEDSRAFSLQDAERVAELSGGNMRRVLGTLRALFDRTDGFASELTEDDVGKAAATLAMRVDSESALKGFKRMLETVFKLRVESDAIVADQLSFDLVAYRDTTPLIVAELKHSSFGQKQQDQVQRFIDKLRVVAQTTPGCVGCFLSASSLDEHLRDTVVQSDTSIVLADLTDPDFIEQLRVSLDPFIRGIDEPSPGANSETGERDVELSNLNNEIQKLKDEQASFYVDLQERLSRAGDVNVSGVTFQPAATDELQDVRRLYEEFIEPPPRARWLSQLVEVRTLPILAVLVAGISLLVLASPIASSIASGYTESTQSSLRVWLAVIGIFGIAIASSGIARVYVLVDRFYSFKRNALRELYLRGDLPPSALTASNNLIESAFDLYGPRRGQRVAADQLTELGHTFGVSLHPMATAKMITENREESPR